MDENDTTFTTLTELISQFPDDASLYYSLGIDYYRKKSWKNAASAFKTAIHKKADYVDAYYHLGLAYFYLNVFTESKICFDAVLQFNKTHMGARFYLGCVYLATAQIDAAFSLFYALHRDYPYHFETQVNLSHCYLAKADITHARLLLESALKLSPTDTQVLFNLGVLAFHQNRLSEAMNYYQSVLEISYDDVAARYNLALSYLNSGLSSEAQTHLQLLSTIAPAFEPAQYLLQALLKDSAVKSAPVAFVSMLFDQYAIHYDAHMSLLHYSVPDKLYALFKQHVTFHQPLDCVIDLGAGTGKMGELLAAHTKRLIGVDVSSAMLEVARAKLIYTELHQDDLTRYLQFDIEKEAADCIVAADSLVYVGDLSTLMQAVASALKPGGYFLFNVEKAEGGQYQLQPTGRFTHAASYIHELLNHAFLIVHEEEVVLRYQDETPVIGYVYLGRI